MEMTVKQARRYKELTIEQMAKALGMVRDTYARLEKNPDRFTIKQAKEFCRITGFTHNEIFFTTTSNMMERNEAFAQKYMR
jgi:DNA-binding XRE family transcriptional regulator